MRCQIGQSVKHAEEVGEKKVVAVKWCGLDERSSR